MSVSTAELFSDEYFADPYPILAHLREDDPVHRVLFPMGQVPVWVLTRYDDVRGVLSDPRFSNDSPAHASAEFNEAGLGFSPLGRSMSFIDPPDHTRLRKLAMRSFTPRNIAKWRQATEDIVGQLLTSFHGGGEIDVITDYSQAIPAHVIGNMLGIESTHRDFVCAQATLMASGDPANVFPAATAMLDFATTLIAMKRADPRDDLCSELVAVSDGTDQITESELASMIGLIVLGGFDTTQTLISNAVLAILDHPAQSRLLRDQPDIAPNAVEEFLRYDGTTSMLAWRFAKEPVTISGVSLPKGATVLCSALGANRDPSRFADPDVLDLRRTDVRHVGLGFGLHNCLGAALARLEAQIAVNGLVSRYPSMRLSIERQGIRHRKSVFMRSLESLPVTLSP